MNIDYPSSMGIGNPDVQNENSQLYQSMTVFDILRNVDILPSHLRYNFNELDHDLTTNKKPKGTPDWWNSTSPIDNAASISFNPKEEIEGSSDITETTFNVAGQNATRNFDKVQIPEAPYIIITSPPKPVFCWTFVLASFIIFIINFGETNFKASPIDQNPFYGPNKEYLIHMGAFYGYLVRKSEWWRLLTATLIHSGLIHLLLIIILCLLTSFFESDHGYFVCIILFFSCSIISHMFASIFSPNFISTGGIYGYAGLASAILASQSQWKNSIFNPKLRFAKSISAIIISLISSLFPYTSLWGILISLIIGFVFGRMLRPIETNTKKFWFFNNLQIYIGYPLLAIICSVTIFFFFDQHSEFCHWCTIIDCIPVSNWTKSCYG